MLTIFALHVQPPLVGLLRVDVAGLQPKMYQSQHQPPLKLDSGGWTGGDGGGGDNLACVCVLSIPSSLG